MKTIRLNFEIIFIVTPQSKLKENNQKVKKYKKESKNSRSMEKTTEYKNHKELFFFILNQSSGFSVLF